MTVILSGDTHGRMDLDKVTDYFHFHTEYTEDDYLIILGDAGILWDGGSEDRQVQSLLEDLPVTVLWIDGNHENFDLLNSCPRKVWHGGKVHMISEKIIHLMRGQIFDIDGRRFFTFGGGRSIDRYARREGTDWWPQEMPSQKEYEEGIRNLERAGWQTDYVLTHTCPAFIAQLLNPYIVPGEEQLQRYFDLIARDLVFTSWYFGHWHMDESIDEFHCLYHQLEVLA